MWKRDFGGTTSTGQCAICNRRCVTLPSNSPERGPWPRVTGSAFGADQDAVAILDLFEHRTEPLGINLFSLLGNTRRLAETPALGCFGGHVGNLPLDGHGRLLLILGMRTLVHDETGSLLAQDLLHAPDGVTVVIKEKTNAAKQSHILWPVIAASATTLHRLELSEFCFPEAKHVLRDFQLIGNFTDRTKGLGRFVHRSNSPPLTSQQPAMYRRVYSAAFLRDLGLHSLH